MSPRKIIGITMSLALLTATLSGCTANQPFSSTSNPPSSSASQPLPRRAASERLIVQGFTPISEQFAQFVFSPDGKRIAYIATHPAPGTPHGTSMSMVVDGIEGPQYSEIFSPWAGFSPDSKHFAYAASPGNNQWVMVMDGVEGKRYARIESPVFSPDGKRLAYKATVTTKQDIYVSSYTTVVVNGVEGKQYRGIDNLRFSPDSRKLAYVAKEWGTDNVLVVVDGIEQNKYSQASYIDCFVFSPDSRRIAYNVRAQDKYFAVVDGVEEPGEVFYGPVFSPDSQNAAYVAEEVTWQVTNNTPQLNVKHTLIMNSEPVKQYRSISNVTFSPDSQRLAYSATPFFEPYKSGGFVVLDGVEGRRYDTTNGLMFSPDSKRFAYRVVAGQHWLVIDGIDGKRYDEIGAFAKGEAILDAGPRIQQLFSPDSKRIAYVASENFKKTVEQVIGATTIKREQTFRNVFVVTDGVEGTKYESASVTNPSFTPDSRKVVYLVSVNKKWFSVVNEVPGKQYDEIYGLSLQVNNSSISYFAMTGTDIYFIEEILE